MGSEMCIRDRYVPFTAVHLPIREPEAWMARVPNEISGEVPRHYACLLYTSDAADERSSVDLGGRRIIKKKKTL